MDHKQTPYPPDVTKDIMMTVAGLAYTYTEPPMKHNMNLFRWITVQRPRVPRTRLSQFSADGPSYESQIAKSANCNEIPKLSWIVHEQVAQFHHWKPKCQNVAGLFPYNIPEYVYLKPCDMWKLGRVPFAEPADPDGTYCSPDLLVKEDSCHP